MGYQISINQENNTILIWHDTHSVYERIPVTIRLQDYGWLVETRHQYENYLFIQGQDLLSFVAETILSNWQEEAQAEYDNAWNSWNEKLQQGIADPEPMSYSNLWRKVNFARKNVRMQISKRLKEAKSELSQNIPNYERIHKLQKALYSAMFPYVVKTSEFAQFMHRIEQIPHAEEDVLKNPMAAYAVFGISQSPQHRETTQTWQEFYTGKRPSNKNFQSLIHNMPGGVPKGMVAQAYHDGPKRLAFPRNIQRRAEAIISLTALINYRGSAKTKDIFYKASSDEIKRAFALYAQAHHLSIREWRRANTLVAMMRYISDAEEIGFTIQPRMNIVGLMRAALQAHENMTVLQAIERLSQYGANAKSELPAIDLPQFENVYFLSCPDDFLEEYKQMHHCIWTYANRALSGECYFFHVEHKEESTTVQIDRFGELIQNKGPYNIENKASLYAAELLKDWMQELKTHSATNGPKALNSNYLEGFPEDIPW